MIASTFFIAHACGDRVRARVEDPGAHPKGPAGAELVKGGHLRRRPPIDVPGAARLPIRDGGGPVHRALPDTVNDSGAHPAEPDRRPFTPDAGARPKVQAGVPKLM